MVEIVKTYDNIMNTIVDYSIGIFADGNTTTWLKNEKIFHGLPISLISSIGTAYLLNSYNPCAAMGMGALSSLAFNFAIDNESRNLKTVEQAKNGIYFPYILAWGAISTSASIGLLKLAFKSPLSIRHGVIISIVSIVSNVGLRSLLKKINEPQI